MQQNQQAVNNVGSDHSTNNIEEAMWGLKIQDSPGGANVAPSGPYPERPGEPDCLYYLRTGFCGYGTNCRYNHPLKGSQVSKELPERVGQPDCGFFLKTGTCKYGSTCKYHHPKDRRGAAPVSFNIFGLPMRQDEKPCPHYMRTGSCKFGVACKFDHPQPAPSETVLPVNGPSVYGSVTSPILPPSGLPYVGSLPAWPLPQVPYPSGPRLQGPQPYVAIPPTQGILAAQGWSTHMVRSMYTSVPNFPERPDQPECRHFMNTGTCKYGADCKYHHPKDRILQFATHDLGPSGLAIRPGQAVCSNYGMHGVCKSGETYKFDHPLSSYPYHYGWSMPPPPILDASLLSYQRSNPADDSSEPSKSLKYSDFPKSDAGTKKGLDLDEKTSDVSTGNASSPETVPSSPDASHDQLS